tara:strand:- start:859 stop:1677 length:819 start_codon:yes stop_codon:yes gene_type:complete
MASKIGLGSIIKNVAGGFISKTMSRLTGSGIKANSRIVNAQAKWSGRNDTKDWRVKLQIPEGSPLIKFYFEDNKILEPLKEGRGFHWPLTPTMVIQHLAEYNALDQTHSNYPHYAYQNSRVDQMSIIGEFPVQNQQDAKYQLAVVHFLRSITKMFFGAEDGYGLKGAPPPILHLSGYGDHMFNKVPVIVQQMSVELRAGIDYISTKQSSVYKTDMPPSQLDNDANQTWAPTSSMITVMVSPIYSRESVRDFSLGKFVRGELNGKGSNEVGFI